MLKEYNINIEVISKGNKTVLMEVCPEVMGCKNKQENTDSWIRQLNTSKNKLNTRRVPFELD